MLIGVFVCKTTHHILASLKYERRRKEVRELIKKALAFVATICGMGVVTYGMSSPDLVGLFASVFGMFVVIAGIEYMNPDSEDIIAE